MILVKFIVCTYEVWGALCDSNWDDADAGVACWQLGYAPFGNLSMKLSDVQEAQVNSLPIKESHSVGAVK